MILLLIRRRFSLLQFLQSLEELTVDCALVALFEARIMVLEQLLLSAVEDKSPFSFWIFWKSDAVHSQTSKLYVNSLVSLSIHIFFHYLFIVIHILHLYIFIFICIVD